MESKTAIGIPEMARRLSIGRATAYELAHRKDFYPAFKMGNRILVSVSMLDQWILEQTSKKRVSA